MLEPPTAQWKECANLLHVKRRARCSTITTSANAPRQKPHGPHFALAGCKLLDGYVGRVRELEQNIAARRKFPIRILLQR